MVQAFERSAKSLGVPLKVICDSRAGERLRYEAALILLRPDQFVAWAGEEGDAMAILSQASGA